MRHLRRKLTLRAHGEQVVLVKRKQERIEHVWMKAFLWSLYLPQYSDVGVEVDIGASYKPDVVAMDRRRGRPVFWAEAGHVGTEKLGDLVVGYPDAHLAIAKWDTTLSSTREEVEAALSKTARTAPVDLFRFPADSADRFLHNDTIQLTVTDLPDALTHHRLAPAE